MLVTTPAGFGHISPSTPLGRVLCIFYALVGIPFNGILLKNISDLLSNKVGAVFLLEFVGNADVSMIKVRLPHAAGSVTYHAATA